MKKFIALFIMVTILLSCSGLQDNPSAERVVSVRTIAVQKQSISFPIHSSGILALEDEIKLSFKTGGIIRDIFFNEGQQVNRRQLLARLDLAEIEARYNQARSALDKSQRDFKRIENLYRDSVVTREQYQNLKTALEMAQSNYSIARFNLKHSSIYAPSAGRILKRFYEEGELVAPGSPLFIFADTEKEWIVKTAFSDRDIVKIVPGDSAQIELDAYPRQLFSGRVKEISAGANPRSGLYSVKIALKDRGIKIFSGFVAKVDIFPALKEEVYLIPSIALVEGENRKGNLFVPTETLKQARKIEVDIVKILDNHVAVHLLEHDITTIITSGAAYLADRDSITIQN